MAQKSQKSITHYFKSPSNNKNETPIAQSKKKEVSKKRKREETDAKLKVEDKILDPVKKEDENVEDDSEQENTRQIEDKVETESKKVEEEDVDKSNGSPQQKKRHTNDSAENENSSVPEEKCKPLIEDNALLDGAEYNPAKHNYHPTKDAFWKKGSDTPYLALSRAFQLIEEIKGRLKSIEILSNFFRSVIVLSPQDLLACMYLSVNQLAPAHEGLELGIAETSLMRAICSATGQSLTHLKSKLDAVGDLGIIAEQARSSQRLMFRPAPLTVKGVFEALKYVAKLSGQSAMNKKLDKIKGIFVACRHSEARYIIRSLLGKLRIGIAEQSALQALANAISSTQSSSTNAAASKKSADEHFMILKTTYCQCPIYDRIIPLLLKHDITELPKLCQMEAGIPIKPMLAQPMTGVHEVLSRFEGMRFTCEFKYDGERAQIHCDEKGTISIYSRNQENNTTKYPDIIERIPQISKEGVTSYIIDSEVVAWDIENKQILPFQKLITRKRKNVENSDIQVQVCVYMFDLLYLNGEALVSRSFIERRQLLRDNFEEVEGQWKFATSCDTNDIDELQQFLELSIKGNCEGLMIKTLEKEADYEIARRSRNWLKLKKDYLSGTGDSLDLVVIGAYTGKGKRTGVYGGFLLACYDANSEEYQCICKIGTGFSDEDLKDHYAALKDHIIKTPKSYYQYDSSLEADVWFEPVLVWEIKCADLSLSPVHKAGVGIIDADKGISLRFPRFLRIRDDKSAEDATSAQQVVGMYLAQSQIVNQNSAARNDMDDFY